MSKEILNDDQVRARAQRWALLHKLPKNRGKMDEILADLSEADQRRVYLCGQRISAGMTPKVVPAEETGKETINHEPRKQQRKKADATGKSASGDKEQVSVGVGRSA